MTHAQCVCGDLRLTLPETPKMVVACHCLDCQRRTGAPFGVGAFYDADAVTIAGERKEFARPGASGGKVRACLCPTCRSTVSWRAEKLPAMIGVAVGAIADPKFPAPSKSVFERTKHPWVRFDGAIEHFERRALPDNPPPAPIPSR